MLAAIVKTKTRTTAKPQGPTERVLITGNHAREQRPAPPRLARPRLQKHGAQHWGGREGNQKREQDGDREGHNEFAEQPAKNATHEQDRNKDRDERTANRENGDADLAGAAEGGLPARHAILDMAGNVFQ